MIKACKTFLGTQKLLWIDDLESESINFSINAKSFETLLYQSRHMNLDIIVASQSIQSFRPAMRHSFNDIVFTTSADLMNYVSTASTGIPKDIKRKILSDDYSNSTIFHIDRQFNVTHQ